MVRMTIVQFEEKLNELLELREKLKKKQMIIHCEAVEDDVLFFDSETLLTFAKAKEILVTVKRNDDAPKTCRYMYRFSYKDVDMIGYSTDTEYLIFKEGGLVS